MSWLGAGSVIKRFPGIETRIPCISLHRPILRPSHTLRKYGCNSRSLEPWVGYAQNDGNDGGCREGSKAAGPAPHTGLFAVAAPSLTSAHLLAMGSVLSLAGSPRSGRADSLR